jgi:hypothetical protein
MVGHRSRDLTLLKEAVPIGRGNVDLTHALVSRLVAPQVVSTDQRGFIQVSVMPDGQSVVTRDSAQRLHLYELELVGPSIKCGRSSRAAPLCCAVTRARSRLVSFSGAPACS